MMYACSLSDYAVETPVSGNDRIGSEAPQVTVTVTVTVYLFIGLTVGRRLAVTSTEQHVARILLRKGYTMFQVDLDF